MLLLLLCLLGRLRAWHALHAALSLLTRRLLAVGWATPAIGSQRGCRGTLRLARARQPQRGVWQVVKRVWGSSSIVGGTRPQMLRGVAV